MLSTKNLLKFVLKKEQQELPREIFSNENSYIPAIIFDETERIFTGEVKLEGDEINNLSFLLIEWHAFSRGHKITPLILGVTTTFSYEVLISSYKSNPDLVRLNQELGVDFIKEPSLFPLLPSLKTYYNRRINNMASRKIKKFR